MSRQVRTMLVGIGALLAVLSIALLIYALAPTSTRVEKMKVRLEPTVFQAPPAQTQP